MMLGTGRTNSEALEREWMRSEENLEDWDLVSDSIILIYPKILTVYKGGPGAMPGAMPGGAPVQFPAAPGQQAGPGGNA